MFYQFFIDANSEDKSTTARGLLLLFMLGFLPLFLGLEIQNFSINLPWLITAEINNPERFIYFYCIAVVYSVYRYYLSNRSLTVCFRAQSIQNFLDNSIFGKHFVNRYIFACNDIYSTNLEENSNSCSIEVRGYSASEDGVPTESFTITIMPKNKWAISAYAPMWLESPFAIRAKEWGAVFHMGVVQEEDDTNYLSADKVNLAPGKVTKILAFWSCLFSAKTLVQDAKFIDFYMPILLNLALVNYIVASSLVT